MESNFITEMQYNSNKYLGGSETRDQTRGLTLSLLCIFALRNQILETLLTQSFGMLESWNVFL